MIRKFLIPFVLMGIVFWIFARTPFHVQHEWNTGLVFSKTVLADPH